MDIFEMHVLFRTLGQQQGLQQVRGILSETIDEYLNEAIVQNVRVAVLGNAQPAKDVRTPQYTKISPLNQFFTLYKTEESALSDIADEGSVKKIELSETPLCITNFALKYNDNSVFDTRLIEGERLHSTLKDYLNRASHDYPIVSLYDGDDSKSFRLSFFTGGKNNTIGSLITSYIKMPAKVFFDEDNYDTENTDSSVSCDLPEHLHYQIVETAVALWFQSLGLTSERQNQTNNNNK